ncbi:MAG: alpha/beta hydrolase [Solobacterium sp.]|nr:alpha/beta hydrolase [Solobacterium sp.]
MELKKWTYEEYPAYVNDSLPVLKTTGEEVAVRYINDVVYCTVDGVDLHLQILVPASRNHPADIYPCVVYVQGSAWMKQDVHAGVPLVAKLAERGFVCAIVEYRHSGIAHYPAPIVDARNAVRFLRMHAKEYRLDPDQIIMAGSSSGGHTAVYAGFRHNDDTEENLFPGVSAEVKGIINYYGSTSFMFDYCNPSTPTHLTLDSPEGREAGCDLSKNEEMKRTMSAECNIHEDTVIAPMLIFHGTKDSTVHPECNVRLYEQMKKTGHDAVMYLLDGAAHGGADFWAPDVIDIAEKFIRKCLEGEK